MTTDPTDSPDPASSESGEQAAGRPTAPVQAAVVVGMLGSLVALVTGVTMALKRVGARCADGTVVPSGSDGRCYVHPRGYEGIVVICVAIVLFTLVFMTGMVAMVALEHRRPIG